jgi:prolipoprotein diacylglyceryltransferase
MVTYGLHRFLNEMLRTDTDVVAFDMTFSQIVSILLLIGAVLLAVYIMTRGPTIDGPQPSASGF